MSSICSFITVKSIPFDSFGIQKNYVKFISCNDRERENIMTYLSKNCMADSPPNQR